MPSDKSPRNLLDSYRDGARDHFRSIAWTGSFADYLEIVSKHPLTIRNAYQRLYDMIVSYGSSTATVHRETVTRYKFFSDPDASGRDAIYGLETALERLVNIIKAGAMGLGAEKRIILLHGPVGSAKSTIARLMKRGLERYSRTDAGALYTYDWNVGTIEQPRWERSPMNEEPLKLVPRQIRDGFVAELLGSKVKDLPYPLRVDGNLGPFCRAYFNEFLEEAGGDWTQVVQKRVRVRRFVLSEQDRVGIGTFQPKDEKNQDSTELTGDINYRKIAEYGSDSDPRAFNFDGEFNVANRGIIEFIEVLKLDVAFLYDLLGASQEHAIKPKKFPQTDIDEVILGHTNEPEYRRLQSNELMEAFRDRTVKVDIPYNTVLKHEIQIYEKDFNARTVKKHIAPHTLRIAAMWSLLTRLEPPKNQNLSLVQKMKLYDGRTITGFTEDNIRELKLEAKREGLHGISPRYIQDKISNVLVTDESLPCINPFMVMNELELGLDHHSLITSEDQKKQFRELLAVVRSEYEDIVKNEVQRAISADEEAIQRLCANYVDNVKAYTQREKLKNRYTGDLQDADERMMRSIEEKIGIDSAHKDDFRREIMNYIGALALENKTFRYDTNQRLLRALELKLFEDQKDSIKLTSIVSSVVDKEAQEKINVVKSRLINHYGYCEVCSTDTLNFVASIFARGDVK